MIILLIELFFVLLFPFIGKRSLKRYFLFVCLILSGIAFFFQPPDNFDLYRHYQTLDNFRANGWTAVKNIYFFSTAPVYALYFYFISILPMNGFLPAITVFITYYLTFSLIYKISLKYKVSKKNTMMVFIFVIFGLDYLSAISGVRNILAFSIFAYCLYYDLVEEKNRILCFIVYGMMCLLHNSCVILLGFRIVMFLYNKYTKRIFQIVFFLWGIFVPFIVKVLDSIPNYYLNQISEKIKTYFVGMMFNANLTLFNLGMSILILVIVVAYKNIDEHYSKHTDYLILAVLFTIGSVKQYDVFIRMGSFLVLSSPYYILRFLNHEKISCDKNLLKIKNLNIIVNIGIIIISILGFMYQMVAYKSLVFAI